MCATACGFDPVCVDSLSSVSPVERVVALSGSVQLGSARLVALRLAGCASAGRFLVREFDTSGLGV